MGGDRAKSGAGDQLRMESHKMDPLVLSHISRHEARDEGLLEFYSLAEIRRGENMNEGKELDLNGRCEIQR